VYTLNAISRVLTARRDFFWLWRLRELAEARRMARIERATHDENERRWPMGIPR
jgi:hypothetical protein